MSDLVHGVEIEHGLCKFEVQSPHHALSNILQHQCIQIELLCVT